MEDDTSTLALEGVTPYAQIPRWVLRSGKDLSLGARSLYGVIMTYADNGTRAAFPSRDTLATDLGVSVRSVGTYIKDLETFGALKVTRRRNRKTGNFYANHYVLVFTDPRAPQEAHCPRPEEASFPRTTPTASTTPTIPPSRSHHPTGDDDSSLRSHHAKRDAPTLTDLAAKMHADDCEDPDAFIEAFEAQHPGSSTDLGHLIINCWGPEGTTERIERKIARGRELGKADPIRWGVAAWVRALPGITHGALGRA